MGPTWVLSAPDGPHIGPMNLAIRVCTPNALHHHDGYRYLSTKWGPDQRQPPFWHCNRRITWTYSSLITYPLCGYLMRQNLCRTRPKYYHNNKCHCKKRRKKRALTVIFNAQIWKSAPPPPTPTPTPPSTPTKNHKKKSLLWQKPKLMSSNIFTAKLAQHFMASSWKLNRRMSKLSGSLNGSLSNESEPP